MQKNFISISCANPIRCNISPKDKGHHGDPCSAAAVFQRRVSKRCAITHACCCRHPSLYRCDQQHHSSKEQERHKGRSIMKRIFEIRDFILHLATGPCWDLSCYEIMFILHCSLSQPSISSLCFHHQEYSVPVTLDTPTTTTTTTHLSWGAHPCSTGPALCLLTGAGWLKHLWHPCSLWAALLTV